MFKHAFPDGLPYGPGTCLPNSHNCISQFLAINILIYVFYSSGTQKEYFRYSVPKLIQSLALRAVLGRHINDEFSDFFCFVLCDTELVP